MPIAPAPTTISQKLSHSLPLVCHVVYTLIVSILTLLTSIMVHIIDGPVLHGWSLMTTISHSFLKAMLTLHPPQGRHSLDLVRFATQFKLPDFLFDATFAQDRIQIQNSPKIAAGVREAFSIGQLHFEPRQENIRSLTGEWVNNRANEADGHIILYLHGGYAQLTSAHIFLSPNSHRVITSRLSESCNAPVFALDYRLAPENPFPAAIEDALAAYLALIQPEGLIGKIFYMRAFYPHINLDFLDRLTTRKLLQI